VRILVFGGVASSGKSSVLRHLARSALSLGRLGVVKVDCVTTSDDESFARAGIPARKVLAERFCPDHVLFERLAELGAWGEEQRLDTLAVETAGLCGRCAPYGDGAVAACVVDCTLGVHAPGKLGPLLADADVCVVTRSDLVSQAEREVFEQGLRRRNPRAVLARVNGLTGEGAAELGALLVRRAGEGSGSFGRPRTPLPQLYCSYCLGRSEAGISVL
jgi:Ni2+-binding GTPase involved in maturation of urease and hydrogenase